MQNNLYQAWELVLKANDTITFDGTISTNGTIAIIYVWYVLIFKDNVPK